jgi:hypothetical protein
MGVTDPVSELLIDIGERMDAKRREKAEEVKR